VTFSGSNDPHTPLAHGWLRASARKLDPDRSLPYRPYHSHDEVRKLVPGERCELDVELWPTCIVAPAGYRLALSVRGKDYVYPGDLGAVSGSIGQPATGVGPFRHEDAEDRPASTFDNELTLHFDAGAMPYVVLPLVPPPTKEGT
jgi:predicted acyl esterase